MTLSDLCKGLYPACSKLKSQSKFLDALFAAGGRNPYISDSYKKQIFNNPDKLTNSIKAPFRGRDNISSLFDFFEKNIDEKVVVEKFGLPIAGTIDKPALCCALAAQFRTIMDSDSSDADIVLMLEYQKYLDQPQKELSASRQISVLYPGDQIYNRVMRRANYEVEIYEKFQHTWDFENSGTQVWRGRKLVFLNYDKVRVRADKNEIDLPDTPPHKGIKVSMSMDARGFEGVSNCHWIMVDADGKDCFPNSSTFDFNVRTKFTHKK